MRAFGPIFLVATAMPAVADDGIPAMLREDVVHVADGKMTMSDYKICDVTNPAVAQRTFQIVAHAEQPLQGGMSRDGFIAFNTAAWTTFTYAAGADLVLPGQSPVEYFHCRPEAHPVGKVDLTIDFRISASGLSVDITDHRTGAAQHSDVTWAEFLGPDAASPTP